MLALSLPRIPERKTSSVRLAEQSEVNRSHNIRFKTMLALSLPRIPKRKTSSVRLAEQSEVNRSPKSTAL